MERKTRRVLITGAAGGIGRACAREFIRSGEDYELVLTDVNQEALDAVVRSLREHGGRIHARVVDVTDRASVEAMARWVIDELGGLDILINNAGIGYSGELRETSLETWKRLIAVNLMGPLYHLYAFLPHMIARGSGHIVNVSSGQAFFQLPTWGAYACIKTALGAVSEVSYFELKKHGIKVTTVYPYLVNTNFYAGFEPKNLAQHLSMKLLPYVAMSPDKVGRIIYDAVAKGKRIELVSTINRVAQFTHAVPWLASGMRALASRFLVPERDPTLPARAESPL